MNYKNLLLTAFEKRTELFDNNETNCFRLFNFASEGIEGLTVDLYGEYILIQYFDDILNEHSVRILKDLESVLSGIPVACKGLLLKNRMIPDSNSGVHELRKSQLVTGEMPPADYTVRQNGITACVDLVEGQSTGIFLDMREVRDELISFYMSGDADSMLNLFSYTGVFSVHALKNGVKSAVNVDLSKGVLARARNNYELNQLKCDNRDFVYGDSIEWMKIFRKKKTTFSFGVFDPPTFARHKKRTFSVKKDYSKSLSILSDLLPGGHVLTAVNSYTVSEEEYISYHPSGWTPVFFRNESSDFPHRNDPYLKVGLWKIT